MRQFYQTSVLPTLTKEFGYKNVMAVPRLDKISVNIGMGEATQNAKVLDPAVNELGQITGQRPVVTRARKSIAAFKVRQGQSIGAMVTLRVHVVPNAKIDKVVGEHRTANCFNVDLSVIKNVMEAVIGDEHHDKGQKVQPRHKVSFHPN